MTVPATGFTLPQKVQEGLLELQNEYLETFARSENLRHQFEELDRAYMGEVDRTQENVRAKKANTAGDASKYQDIVIPLIYPSVEEATNYQTEVFCTGYPVFSVVADPKNQDAALQMNVLMEEHSIRGGWPRQLMLAFREGFKYNIFCLEVAWESQTVAALSTDVGKSVGEATSEELIWSGNVIKYRSMYNVFWDLRYSPADVSDRGEYAGYHELMSRTELRTYINNLPNRIIPNILPALASSTATFGSLNGDKQSYYEPTLRTDVNTTFDKSKEPDWDAWSQNKSERSKKIDYKNTYVVTVLYARIIPDDFGMRVPKPGTPQIWKFVYVNHSVLISAERLTNAHNKLPMVFGQPSEDGLAYQTKSLAKNMAGFQSLATAMMKAKIASHRKAVGDRMFYDPSRISEHHINSSNPAAKIPVRPAAFGKDIKEAVLPIPFRDDQGPTIMGDIQAVMQFGDLTSGQNRARRGQFQKGNKTLHEYEDVMQNSTGRDRMTAILLEFQVLIKIKEMLKTNILQYQGVANIFSTRLEQDVSIDPVKLRKIAMGFKVSDGLTPASKIINGDVLQTAFQAISAPNSPVAAQYNLGPLFSYMMSTQNTDLSPFQKSPAQVAYEQAAMQWQQMGMLAMEKGTEFKVPQPTPQQFGYNPEEQVQQTATAQQALAAPNAEPQNG